MSKLSIDQKTIEELFSDKKTDFLIPDYQRPYAWEFKECQQLWEDIFSFAFPDDDYERFNNDDEYYLGTIVTFKNGDSKKLEVIDGQQRLTTLMLLLRAFYAKFGNMRDRNSVTTRETIGKCIWKGDEFGNLDVDVLKIDSQVATDNDKDEFLKILRDGVAAKEMKSKYAENYRYFEGKISEFLNTFPGYFPYLPNRILKNCILLPIEAESQDTALRIFSTLNNRGIPLSDADIFKSEFYKKFTKLNRKNEFISRWKELEEKCNQYFHPISGTPLDELFTRYMYYERAKDTTKTTTEALRTFYSKNKYELLNEHTLNNLEKLMDFWKDVLDQSEDRFSPEVIRQLFILEYAPNGMWTYFLSVYYMSNKDECDMLDNEKLVKFLKKIIAFIWTFAVTNPGVNALRTPVYKEMNNIRNGIEVEFNDAKFDEEKTKNALKNFNYLNGRPVTKSMLVWWAMITDNQVIPDISTIFEIEHIYARNRNDKEHTLSKATVIELLGNKAILEKRINIRASDYRFMDKKKYYLGYTNKRNEIKEGTVIKELELFACDATRTDFTETDIHNRTNLILNKFFDYLKEENLFA